MDPNREAEEDFKEYKKTRGSIFLVLIGGTLLGVAWGAVAGAIFASISVCLEVTERPASIAQRRIIQLLAAFSAVAAGSLV
jgi:uncharacterized membrane protein YjjP (DUF1212 family)